ncbi:MAG: metallophosphoesterase [Bacteroidales bacterium]|nr:metallophosphoesterase [Bacteroidales bacterium]
MRLPLLPIMIVLIIGIIVDIYLYRRMRHDRVPRVWCVVYTVIAVLGAMTLLSVIMLPKRSGGEEHLAMIMWLLYAYFTIYLPKYVMAVFSLLRKLLALIFHRPLKGISYVGAALGLTIFATMAWGTAVNRYTTEVKDVDIDIKGLPEAFDGLRIAQISDFHVGSYAGDTTFVAEVVDRINSLHPDLIVFTGDLVNRRSEELYPYMSPLSRLKAPCGVWSVMGNHDYGDYFDWPDETMHRADADSLKAMQSRMGWRMLNNGHALLHAGSDTIALIGVENIGDPPFKTYGDLDKASAGLPDGITKILLSHNPMHWVDSISGHDDIDIALTLSGHTHAMQMEFFGWSPAEYRYPTWSGRYTDQLGRHLYVNIGLGEVALPARLGSALPEITLFTLKSK